MCGLFSDGDIELSLLPLTLSIWECEASPARFWALQVKLALCSGLSLSIRRTDSKLPRRSMEIPGWDRPTVPGTILSPSLNQVSVIGRSPSVTEHIMETLWPRRRLSATENLFRVGGTARADFQGQRKTVSSQESCLVF